MRRFTEKSSNGWDDGNFSASNYDLSAAPGTSESEISDKVRRDMRSWRRLLHYVCPASCRTKLCRFLFAVVIFTNIGATFWIMVSERSLPEYFHADIHTSAALKSYQRCYIPTLNPFEQEIKQFMEKPERVNCPRTANIYFNKIAFEAKRNSQENVLVQKLPVEGSCCYRPFTRVSDAEVWLEPTRNQTYVCHQITKSETVIPPEHEFVEVICGFAGANYKDAFAFVSRKPQVEKRIKAREERKKVHANTRKLKSSHRKEKTKAPKLSVIILGMDSTSQMNFIRMMPKSQKYLLQTLSAIQLKGYNKVGENTLPNVVPLLTGLHLADLKKRCVDPNEHTNSAVHLDKCPFIWKNFSSKGYRTSFAEDEVNTGVFNLQWTQAFETQPTDHYFRTFSLRMVNNHASEGGLCFGTRMTFDILLQYLKDTAATYKHDPYFQFIWSSKLTHDDFNRLAWGDAPLLSTLKYLNKEGHLNESVLFLMGDHGSRNEYVRKTHQGQIEDRLPLAYIVLPTWFRSEYPRAWKNLQENADKLTTAFDVYETLKDLLDLSKLTDPTTYYERGVTKKFKSKNGVSLFMDIPVLRGCIAAGVPQHWCICYKKTPILTDSFLVKSAARFALASFNRILQPYQRICEPLRLFQVTRALQWRVDDFDDRRVTEGEDKEEEQFKTSMMVQLSFTVLPGLGSFEITLLNHPDHGFKLTDEIVRLNRYEGQGDCIHQELKILCQCKYNNGEKRGISTGDHKSSEKNG